MFHLRSLRRVFAAPALSSRSPHVRPGIEALEDRWLPSTIGGLVYADANNNGIHDPGEMTIAGNTIELHRADGTLLDTTTTDSTGRYAFKFDPTSNPTLSTKEVDADFANARTDTTRTLAVNQFDPSLGTLTAVEIIHNGTLVSHLKVESDDSQAATISGSVTATLSLKPANLDAVNATATNADTAAVAAADGVDDFAGASGKDFGVHTSTGTQAMMFQAADRDLSAFIGQGTVNLTETAHVASSITGAGNLLAAVSSQASAHVRVIYHYKTGAALQPGDYQVVQPSEPPGFFDGKDTNDNATPIAGSDQTDTIAVHLGNGDSTNNNFGELRLASLAGSVYLDANRNGQLDNADRLLANVTLNLSGSDDLSQEIHAIQQTDANGAYKFDGLRPGIYTIAEMQPANLLDGTNTVGSLGGSTSGDSFAVNVPANGVGTGYNFGETTPLVIPPPAPNGDPVPLAPGDPAPSPTPMSKRDFIGGAWKNFGW